MASPLPLTELILNHPQRSLGMIQDDWMPQPGMQMVYQGQAYTVLERRHRYQFIANRYELHKIQIYVQASPSPTDKSWVGDRWVMGDATCAYNAQSEMMRCAVNPTGPCDGCPDYHARHQPISRPWLSGQLPGNSPTPYNTG
ncbi:MAG: DUF6464 family protein [Leptolyngbyaceae cyanobacterium]